MFDRPIGAIMYHSQLVYEMEIKNMLTFFLNIQEIIGWRNLGDQACLVNGKEEVF